MKHSATLLLCMIVLSVNAQNVGIGTKNPQNKLHVAGGVRIDSLASKKDSGLILHNKTGDLYSISLTGNKSDLLRGDGTFAASASPTDAWLLGGNSGTDSNENFIGTTDNAPLRIRVNGGWFGSLGPNVSLGKGSYGTMAFWEPFMYETVPDNVAIGNFALGRNGSGNYNVAVGSNALQDVFGHNNTALGFRAQLGQQSHDYVQDASGNTAVGSHAMENNSFSDYNTAVGMESMASNAFSHWNTAVGYRSLYSLGSEVEPQRTGYNVAIGGLAMFSNVTGTHNTAVGYEAQYSAVEPLYSTAIGYRALFADAGSENSAIGAFALTANTTGTANGAFGMNALATNTTGSSNNAFGRYSLYANTTGNFNTAVGGGAMFHNTTGSSNSAFGLSALGGNISGENNTAVGGGAMSNNTTGSYNSAFGLAALRGNISGGHNTAAGAYALYNNTGELNAAFGSNAMSNNTTGTSNTAVGYMSMSNNQTGNANTAAGTRALGSNTTGVNNTALGYGALLTNAGGSLNTAVGMYADVTTSSLSNATAIGYGAKVNASNKVRIGNAAVTVIEGQVPFTTPSDGRFKFNVKEDVGGLAFILKLRPVTYQFDVKKFDNIENISFASAKNDAYEKASLIRRTGFIAQEVEKAAEETHYNFSGVVRPDSQKEHYSLSYEAFVVPLVKGMQEQQEIIDAQNKKLEEQAKKMEELLKRIEQLEKK